MTVFTHDPHIIYAGYDAAGRAVPLDVGAIQLDQVELHRLVQLAITTGNLIAYDTRAELDADLAHDAGAIGLVLDDATISNNGLYAKQGATSAGLWARRGDVPFWAFVVATAAGGAVNAYAVTTAQPVNGSQLITAPIAATNTDTPTIAFNGGTPLTIVTASGTPVPAGGLVGGMEITGRISGSEFRMISDQASAAIQGAAESAAAASAAARDAAEAFRDQALSATGLLVINDRADFEAGLASGDYDLTPDGALFLVGGARLIKGDARMPSPSLNFGFDPSQPLHGKYFGLDGSGGLKNQAWQDVAEAFSNVGGELIVGAGDYEHDATANLPDKTLLAFRPGARVEYGGGIDTAMFSWVGAAGPPVAVTADVSRHRAYVDVAAGAELNFTPQHIARIKGSKPFDPARTATLEAELQLVRSVGTPGRVIFHSVTEFAYDLSDGAISVTPIQPVTRCGIRGGEFFGAAIAGSNELLGFSFRNAVQPFVDNVTMHRFDDRAVAFYDCIAPRLTHWDIRDANTNSTGYGPSILNATRDAFVGWGLAVNLRHWTSTNNESALGGVVLNSRFYGITGMHTSTALSGSMAPGDGFDEHAAARGSTWEWCRALYGRSAGFNCEGQNPTLLNCSAIRPDGRGLNINNRTRYRSRVLVRDFVSENSGDDGIAVVGGMSGNGTVSARFSRVLIDNATIDGGDIGIYHVNSDGTKTERVDVINSHISNTTGLSAIRVQDAVTATNTGSFGSDNSGPFEVYVDVDNAPEAGAPDLSYQATIAGGLVTGVTATTRLLIVDTQGGAATDDLWGVDVTNMADGQMITIVTNSSLRNVTIKDAGGVGAPGDANLRLAGNADVTTNDNTDTVTFIKRGPILRQIAHSDN